MKLKRSIRYILGLFLVIIGCGSFSIAAPGTNFTKVGLKNGITLMYKVMPNQPMVSMDAIFPIGFSLEKMKGIAHLHEHLVFRGSSEYSYQDIAQATIRQGGVFNGFTTFYNTSYNYVTTKEDFEKAFTVFNTSIWRPNFTPANVAMEKKIIGYELDMDYAEQYSYYPVVHYFYPEMYHSVDTLAPITIEDLQEFHRSFYRTANATYVIAGDFNPQTVIKALEQITNPEGVPTLKADKADLKGLVNFPHGERVEERNIYPYQYQILMAYEWSGLSPQERMCLRLLDYVYSSDLKIDYERDQYKIYNVLSRSVGPKDYFGVYYLERDRPFTPEDYQKERANMLKYITEFKRMDFKRQLKKFIKAVELEMQTSQSSPEKAVDYEVQRQTDPDNTTVDSLALLRKLNEKQFRTVLNKYLSQPPTTWILVKNLQGGGNQ